jgi:Fe2+ or Zn2+ uptake regulation protein
MKLTEKQLFIKDLLSHYEKGATCYDIIKDYSKELTEKGIDTKKINSVNATLASLATKGLVSKVKTPYNDKLVTLYTLIKENN